jgi:phytoene dehydrogenase-like protein
VERFQSGGARRLLAGLALHADLMPEAALSGLFGWIMAGLAQEVGFPVPEGGASSLTDALIRRMRSKGATIECGETVVGVEVRHRRAVAVRTQAGAVVRAERAVLADVDAVQLYTSLVAAEHLPSSTLRHIGRFHWDHATFKVDWNLDGPIPWSAPSARRAGTVHVVEDVDELTMSSARISTGQVPADPFLVMGQLHVADPTRQPEGAGTAFAYTHLPRRIRGDAGPDGISGDWAGGDGERFADRIEARVETLAPGFRSSVRGRHVMSPVTFSEEERNMPLGALNLGTSQLHQEAFLRPIPGLGRSETPVKGLYLASASAHPGGGVHGACGANAARAALVHHRLGSPVAALWSRKR